MYHIHTAYRQCSHGLSYHELYCTDEITEHRDNGTQTTFSCREAVDYRDVDHGTDSACCHGDDVGVKSFESDSSSSVIAVNTEVTCQRCDH